MTMQNDRSHYELLEVSPDANAEQIRRAYRTQMRRAHPDRGGSEELARELSAAYAVLMNSERRREYDLELAQPEWGDEQLVDGLEADAVVDDWGAAAPVHQRAPAPTAGGPPPPPSPPWGQPPPPPRFWPQGFESSPALQPVKPWQRIWMVGDDAWVQTARVLTVVILFALIGPWLMTLALTIAGSGRWDQMPTNTLVWLVICAIVFLPFRRRLMGGGIHFPYILFVAFGVGGSCVSWTSNRVSSVVLGGWTVLMIITAEVRHYTIVSGRGRVR